MTDHKKLWFLLKITAHESIIDCVQATCWECRCIGIEEKSLDDGSVCSLVYYSSQDDCHSAMEKIRIQFQNKDLAPVMETTRILDENWKSSWHRFFHPREIGDRFLVHPPWEKPRSPENRQPVEILPGQAFGTGLHESTAICIELMEQFDFSGLCLDVGCGSGILSIIALLLGARKAVAVDIDLLAAEETRINAARNGMAERIAPIHGTAQCLMPQSFDCVTANLELPIFKAENTIVSKMVKNRGLLIISGFLAASKTEILRLFQPFGMNPVMNINKNEWAGIAFRNDG